MTIKYLPLGGFYRKTKDVGSTLVDKNFASWRKPYLTHYYVILSKAKNL